MFLAHLRLRAYGVGRKLKFEPYFGKRDPDSQKNHTKGYSRVCACPATLWNPIRLWPGYPTVGHTFNRLHNTNAGCSMPLEGGSRHILHSEIFFKNITKLSKFNIAFKDKKFLWMRRLFSVVGFSCFPLPQASTHVLGEKKTKLFSVSGPIRQQRFAALVSGTFSTTPLLLPNGIWRSWEARTPCSLSSLCFSGRPVSKDWPHWPETFSHLQLLNWIWRNLTASWRLLVLYVTGASRAYKLTRSKSLTSFIHVFHIVIERQIDRNSNIRCVSTNTGSYLMHALRLNKSAQ